MFVVLLLTCGSVKLQIVHGGEESMTEGSRYFVHRESRAVPVRNGSGEQVLSPMRRN